MYRGMFHILIFLDSNEQVLHILNIWCHRSLAILLDKHISYYPCKILDFLGIWCILILNHPKCLEVGISNSFLFHHHAVHLDTHTYLNFRLWDSGIYILNCLYPKPYHFRISHISFHQIQAIRQGMYIFLLFCRKPNLHHRFYMFLLISHNIHSIYTLLVVLMMFLSHLERLLRLLLLLHTFHQSELFLRGNQHKFHWR